MQRNKKNTRVFSRTMYIKEKKKEKQCLQQLNYYEDQYKTARHLRITKQLTLRIQVLVQQCCDNHGIQSTREKNSNWSPQRDSL